MTISLKSAYNTLKLSSTAPQNIPVMASVSIADMVHESSVVQELRPGVDLVCVIDVSGSMSGAKILLVKQALIYLIKMMRPKDRISLVIFNQSAKRLCPLKLATPENLV